MYPRQAYANSSISAGVVCLSQSAVTLLSCSKTTPTLYKLVSVLIVAGFDSSYLSSVIRRAIRNFKVMNAFKSNWLEAWGTRGCPIPKKEHPKMAIN
jgi:hypothetical protein